MKRLLCLLICLCLLSGGVVSAVEDGELAARMDDFIYENDLDEENFAVYYYNPSTGEEFSYNETAFLPAGETWLLPLHMYYYEQETDGAFDPPREDPLFVYTIGGMTLEECRYHSILLGENEVSLQMRDNLGAREQYLLLINETYGHCDPDRLPDSYFSGGCYSAEFLMNCMRAVSERPEKFGNMMKNFSMIQTADGLADYGYPYNLVHVRGAQDGFVCDLGEISGPTTYLLVCFASEDAGGDELVARVNALFCAYVEEQSGIVAESTVLRPDRERNDTDFIVGSVGAQDNSDVLRWIAISLGALAAVALVVGVIVWILRRRKDDRI